MANYATTYTKRYVVRYQGGEHTHTHLWRLGPTQAAAPVIAALTDFYETLAGIMPNNYTLIDAKGYLAGSENSFPADTPPMGNVGLGNVAPGQDVNSISFIARSAGGSNYKIRVFGVNLTHTILGGVNYRFSQGENPTIDSCVQFLQGIPELVGIDRQPLTWRTYANFRYDGYWQGQQR